ncbi:MAG: TM0106 family RecB-like putative nuclease [Planctomycetota bacterium]
MAKGVWSRRPECSEIVLPDLEIPGQARRDRITGSLIYEFLRCEHAVHLELFAEPERRLPPGPALEKLLARGREYEQSVVAGLDYAEPAHDPRDLAQGARATLGLMTEAVPGISQGVLERHPYLGIPDLLRREAGASRFGDYHYVAGDIKSSYRSRSDQALQVTFYSCLLGEIQERVPGYGYLILRDGREERLDLAALLPVLLEVIEEIGEHLQGAESRPHRSVSCRDCRWRELCAESPDVFWIPGLTRSVRSILQESGYATLDALASADPKALGKAGRLPESTWERARSGARAVRQGRAQKLREPRSSELGKVRRPAVILRDGFERRFPVFGSLADDGRPRMHLAMERGEEEQALTRFLNETRGSDRLCHAGGLPASLYYFAERFPHLVKEAASSEARSVDVMSLVRGAWIFPAPVSSPGEALAWIRGEAPDEPGEDVALLLDAGDAEGLLELARRDLEALRLLLGVLDGKLP